jgi:hypothetical protein
MYNKKIDQRVLDSELMNMVRGDRGRKRPVVSHKPPKKEGASKATVLGKRPA